MGNYLKFVPILIILWCGYAIAVTCPAGQWVNAINPQACSTPVASGSGTYPSGSPPQVTGYSAANTPEAETISNDCTFTRTGANAYKITCVSAGGGTGNFEAGSLGVGTTADGTAGDANFTTSINVGTVTTSTPDAVNGDVTINNTLTCQTNAVACVAQLDNTLTSRTMAELNSINVMVFGNNTVLGQLTQLLGGSSGSVTITAGAGSLTINNTGDTIASGLAGGLKMTNGSVLSFTGGTKPTCSSATGTCTTTVGSTDNRGQMVLSGGTGVTSLTLNFNHTWPQQAFCNFTDSSGGTTPVAYAAPAGGKCAATTSCVVSFASVSAASVNYICF